MQGWYIILYIDLIVLVLESFGEFYKNRSFRENSELCQHYVCGVKLVDVVKVQVEVNQERQLTRFPVSVRSSVQRGESSPLRVREN